MSIISRRQRNLLLNDVARMIGNNINAAFANHAKIAECVSNGDLKFYIDSPKKEFVIKYGSKTITFSANEQKISLKSIQFDEGIINGITDSFIIPSSKIALSTVWGMSIKNDLSNKADKNHTHKINEVNNLQTSLDNKSDKGHKHGVDDVNGLQTSLDSKTNVGHKHNVSDVNNLQTSLDLKSNLTHKHDERYVQKETDKKIWSEKEIKDLIEKETEPSFGEKLLKILGYAADVGSYLTIAGLQAEINSIYGILASNGLIDGVQSVSQLGLMMNGLSSKLKAVSDVVTKIGKNFKSVSDTCKKIVEPLNNATTTINRYRKIVNGVPSVPNIINNVTNGMELTTSRLPDLMTSLIP